MTPRFRGFGIPILTLAALMLSSTAVHGWGSKKKSEDPQPAAKQAVSAKVGAPLRAAQEAIQKQDWDTAYAKIQDAQAVSGKTPYDEFQIAEMLGYVELKRQKYAEASAAFEQSIASGLLPPGEATDRLKLVAQLALQFKDYPKAAQFAAKAIESAATPDSDLYAILGQAQYLAENYPAAADAMSKAADAARKAGKPVSENWLQVQLSSHAQAKDVPGVLHSLQQLAIAFPKKKYLTDLFNQWKRSEGDDRLMLNLHRLVFALGILEESEDYLRLAQLAVSTGMPGEAVSVLEKAKADKVFSDEVDAERARRQLQVAKEAAATDRKTLQSMKAATGERSGEDAVQLGLAAMSFGEYQLAADALQSGIAKGGVKRVDQAQLLLGQTLLKLNRMADAKAAFDSVDAASKLKVAAQLWEAYTSRPVD
jgi:hypothetical protein